MTSAPHSVRGPEGRRFAEESVARHIEDSAATVATLSGHGRTLLDWADRLGACFANNGRLLVAGNGGSAAEAQHLTAELVGRFDGDRPPFSAIPLHADTSALTAIGNDFGYEQTFERQVHAHARSGDVLILLTTSGRSANLIRAVRAASVLKVQTLAMTGAAPNSLASAVESAICVAGPRPQVQEGHLVLIHALCKALEPTLREIAPAGEA
ncbi:SIS domain-containing protein [Kribbella sp. NPDC059898]|uniref:D-sedoheptulose-7-phosphate isomerase n=1 Tax=Kribbella sp. NPDC059898 TaxID=3346995 RepID=UPI0036683E1C